MNIYLLLIKGNTVDCQLRVTSSSVQGNTYCYFNGEIIPGPNVVSPGTGIYIFHYHQKKKKRKEKKSFVLLIIPTI